MGDTKMMVEEGRPRRRSSAPRRSFHRTGYLICYFQILLVYLTAPTARGLLMKDQLTAPDYRTAVACEGDQLNITCEEGTRINIIRANFGRFSISICNKNGNLDWSVDCMSPKSLRVMHGRCYLKEKCLVNVTLDTFENDDPCPNTEKYLEVHFVCRTNSQTHTYESPKKHIPGHNLPKFMPIPPSWHNESKTLNRKSPVLVVVEEKSETPIERRVGPQGTERKDPPVVSDDSLSSVSPSSVSTMSSTRSSTIYPQISSSTEDDGERDGIYVKHPFPRPQEQSTQSTSTASSNAVDVTPPIVSKDSTVFSSVRVSPPTTTIASIDPQSYCSPAKSRNLTWSWTPLRQFASQPCPSGSIGYAKWLCTNDTGSPRWIPPEADLSGCSSTWVTGLETSFSSGNVSVLRLAKELSSKTSKFAIYGGDVQKISDMVDQLVSRMELFNDYGGNQHKNYIAKEMLDHIQASCSNLLQDFQRHSWMDLPPRERKDAAMQLIGSLERTSFFFSETITSHSDHVRGTENIYVGVHTRLASQLGRGVSLPHQVSSSAASLANESFNGYLLSSTSVFLPPKVLRHFERNGIVRLSFVIYNKLDTLLEPVEDQQDYDPALLENGVTTFINSDVIGVLLSKEMESDAILPANIKLTFRHIATVNVSNPKCVFWDFVNKNWSTSGCRLLAYNQTHTSCECSHLTNFAILMEIREVPLDQFDEAALRIITLFGCSLSVICLILTLITFFVFKNLKGDRTTIHINLCLCLLIGEAVFLLGIEQTHSALLCRGVAVLLHYIFLAAFLWMFFEGFQLYVMLIEVFESERSRIRWYYIFSYGIPLVIVCVCYSLDDSSYGTGKHCWLRTDNYFILSFVGPVIAILMANLVFLSIALCVMWKHLSTMSSVSKPHKDHNKLKSLRREIILIARRKQFIMWLKGAFTLVFLLGLTWTFGVLYLNQETIIMAYLFTIFNSSQGLFIFIFHCLQNEKVRKEYRKVFGSVRCMAACFDNFSSESTSGITSSNYDKRKSSGSSSMTPNQATSSHNPEPMIAPNSGSALAPTIRQVSTPAGGRYFVTGKLETPASQDSEYGFRAVGEEVRSKQQKQRCKPNCDHVLRNPLVEHVYECIDDDPYTAKMFAPSAYCSCKQESVRYRAERCATSEQENKLIPKEKLGGQEIQLPAIICDNTKCSTVISKPNKKLVASPKIMHQKQHEELCTEKRNMVAKFDGNQVVTSAVSNLI